MKQNKSKLKTLKNYYLWILVFSQACLWRNIITNFTAFETKTDLCLADNTGTIKVKDFEFEDSWTLTIKERKNPKGELMYDVKLVNNSSSEGFLVKTAEDKAVGDKVDEKDFIYYISPSKPAVLMSETMEILNYMRRVKSNEYRFRLQTEDQITLTDKAEILEFLNEIKDECKGLVGPNKGMTLNKLMMIPAKFEGKEVLAYDPEPIQNLSDFWVKNREAMTTGLDFSMIIEKNEYETNAKKSLIMGVVSLKKMMQVEVTFFINSDQHRNFEQKDEMKRLFELSLIPFFEKLEDESIRNEKEIELAKNVESVVMEFVAEINEELFNPEKNPYNLFVTTFKMILNPNNKNDSQFSKFKFLKNVKEFALEVPAMMFIERFEKIFSNFLGSWVEELLGLSQSVFEENIPGSQVEGVDITQMKTEFFEMLRRKLVEKISEQASRALILNPVIEYFYKIVNEYFVEFEGTKNFIFGDGLYDNFNYLLYLLSYNSEFPTYDNKQAQSVVLVSEKRRLLVI
jgi:hypothetical protein